MNYVRRMCILKSNDNEKSCIESYFMLSFILSHILVPLIMGSWASYLIFLDFFFFPTEEQNTMPFLHGYFCKILNLLLCKSLWLITGAQ